MFLKVNSVALQINKYCEENQPIIEALPDISHFDNKHRRPALSNGSLPVHLFRKKT